MCFIKSSGASVVATAAQQPDPVERHEANASITKNSQISVENCLKNCFIDKEND